MDEIKHYNSDDENVYIDFSLKFG